MLRNLIQYPHLAIKTLVKVYLCLMLMNKSLYHTHTVQHREKIVGSQVVMICIEYIICTLTFGDIHIDMVTFIFRN